MSASPPPTPSPSDEQPDNRYARFSEFSITTGDAKLQNDLAKELNWQATRTITNQNIESTIQMRIDAVSDLLSELYTNSERDIFRRNEELAIRTSLPNISKWNQQLIQGHKASKLRRSEISKELAIVHALLKRTARTRSKSKRKSPKTPSSLASHLTSTLPSRATLLADVRRLSAPNAVLFTVVICTLALESFESVVSQENGPSTLANYAAFVSAFVVSCTYFHTLRSAHCRARADLRKRSVAFMNKGAQKKQR
ncbi:unnamed protein product [Agarophyton chilense]